MNHGNETSKQESVSESPTSPMDDEKKQETGIEHAQQVNTAAQQQQEEPPPSSAPSPPPSKYYTEETAWRLHGGRLDSHGHQIDKSQIQPLPEAPPMDTSTFPKSGRWSFDVDTRVLFGDFRHYCNSQDQQKQGLDPEDEHFLLTMMARDDITVISEGFAAHLNPNLWTLRVLKEIAGTDVCHQFRVFERVLEFQAANSGSNIKTDHEGDCDQNGTQNKVQWFQSYKEHANCRALQMKDYIRYIYQRKEQLKCIAQRRNGAGVDPAVALDPTQDALYRNPQEEKFVYKNSKGEEHTLNCVDTVLYMIDYDIGKLLPTLHQDFVDNFMAPNLLPGSQHCMMHEVRLFCLIASSVCVSAINGTL